MPSVDELNERFAVSDVARFEPGGGGLPRLKITAPLADGEIYLHGAHITHFQPRGRKPVLFLSAKSHFEHGKPIRGGVPLIFPWFGPHGQDAAAPMHGLVRTRAWEVQEVSQEGGGVRVMMALASSPETRAVWPHDFELRFTAAFGASLTMELQVRNTSQQVMRFEEALHTYFAVGDIRSVTVDGLGDAEFLDKEKGHARFRQESSRLKLAGVTDRVYIHTRAACIIDDPASGRQISVEKEHSGSTVVWNPWEEKIRTMADLDPRDWLRYLCIETCNVKENALSLEPGAAHTMRAAISLA